MRFLPLISCCLLGLAGCSSVYKNLSPADGDVHAVTQFRPKFTVALYRTEVNVTSHHLSGILLLKKMPDSSLRLVFSNETGVKFFDFAFLPGGDFKVYAIIKQMDKKAVITTLRKDFELVLMRKLNEHNAYLRRDGHSLYYVFPQARGANYYVTNLAGDSLLRMERGSDRKPVVIAIMKNWKNGLPDTIGIEHKVFTFNIGLKKIDRHAAE
jgi:hypothetical protein